VTRRAKGDGGLSWDAVGSGGLPAPRSGTTVAVSGSSVEVAGGPRPTRRTSCVSRSEIWRTAGRRERRLHRRSGGRGLADVWAQQSGPGDAGGQPAPLREARDPTVGRPEAARPEGDRGGCLADRAFDHVEHAHAAGDSVMSEPSRKAGHGTGSSSAERGRAD